MTQIKVDESKIDFPSPESLVAVGNDPLAEARKYTGSLDYYRTTPTGDWMELPTIKEGE